MSNNKKDNNKLLNLAIRAGSTKENAIVNPTEIKLLEKQPLPEQMPITSEVLPEKNVSAPVIEDKNASEKEKKQKLSEKIGYAAIIKKRGEKESIEKANILTSHRNILKRISTAEGVSIQDLLANIIDEFALNYKDEIRQSCKKLLM